MTVLPVVARELSVQARRKSTYWIRVLASASAGFLMLWLMVFAAAPLSSVNHGKALFSVLSTLAFVYCLFVGATVTADCLSSEKRDGTIGLLFLTPLKGYDVVFGKLVSSSIHAVFGLLAVVPMMALALLFGGLTAGEISRTALVLANTLFLSLAAGIFTSTISRNERKAVFAAIFLVLMVAAAPYEVAFYLANMSFSRGGGLHLDEAVLAISPVYAFTLSRGAASAKFENIEFYGSLAQTHAIAWVLLTLASGIVPGVCKDRPSGKRKERWTESWRRWMLGDRTKRAAFRTRLLDLNPILWLSLRDRYKSLLPWVLIMPLFVIGVWIFHKYALAFYESVLLLVFVIQVMLKVWFTGETCSRWIEDRRGNALELLLCAPLRTKQIVGGQDMALFRQFGWPVAAVVGITILALMGIARTAGLGTLAQGGRTWLMVSIPVFIADFIALRWVGMWNGLTAQGLNRAVMFSLGRVLFVRWPIYLALAGMASAGTWIGIGNFWVMAHPAVWLLLALVVDAALALQARRRFYRHFRALAADPSDTRRIDPEAEGAPPVRHEKAVSFAEAVLPRPRAKLWSVRYKAFVAVGVLSLLGFGSVEIRRQYFEKKLDRRLQELRRRGLPTTRDELERMRPGLPDAENAAVAIENAFSALLQIRGLPQLVQRELPGRFAAFPDRVEPLKDRTRLAIEHALKSNQAALDILDDVPDFGSARWAMDWNNGFSKYGIQSQGVTMVANLFLWESYFRSDVGDVEKSVLAVRRLFELCRSFDDEVWWTMHQRRCFSLERAFFGLEWLMNRQALNAADLAGVEAEVVRAEKAEMMPGVLKGLRVYASDYLGPNVAVPIGTPPGSTPTLERFRMMLQFQFGRWTGGRAADLIEILGMLDSLEAVVGSPYPERFRAAKRLNDEVWIKATVGNRNQLCTPQFFYQALIVPEANVLALGRGARTAIALERYRRNHDDRLPEDLDQLVPQFLEKVPRDPFDGQSIRFRRTSRGYCVYSIGSDGVDNGGAEVKDRKSSRLPKANYDITFTVER